MGYVTYFTNWISSSNFACSATAKPRSSAEHIKIKISLLSQTQTVLTVIVLPILKQTLQMCDCS